MRLIDADAKKFCIHSDGLGYCDILSDDETRQYCVESPCPHEKLVEYEPVRHARWVKDRDGDEYCENCSRYMPSREVTGDPSATNYCPNCGADMRGTKDE